MSDILERYYLGVTQQLRAEVDFINNLFNHQGVKGQGNETLVRDLIARFVPKRYAVGTGIVIDSFGNQSRQCDIVIYDNVSHPSVLSLGSAHLFPVDIVYATIEVKTTLTSGSAQEAKENIASIKRLRILDEKFTSREPPELGRQSMEYQPISPIGIVFAFNSDTENFNTFKKWFTPEDVLITPQYPSLIGCLDQGVLIFGNQQASEDRKELNLEVFANPEPDMQLFGLVGTVDDPSELPINVIPTKDNPEEFEYKLAGIYKRNTSYKGSFVSDPGLTLLNFVQWMTYLLSMKHINPSPLLIQRYLGRAKNVSIVI